MMSDHNQNTATILLSSDQHPRELVNGTCHAYYWHDYDGNGNTMILDLRPEETTPITICATTDHEALEEIIERLSDGWELVPSKNDEESV
jgi:hypothetical protein